MDIPIVKSVVLLAYLFLILMGLLVPSSGSHGFLHPKSLAFITLSFVLTGYFLLFKRSMTKGQLTTILSILLFLTFTLFWLILGLLHPRIETVFPLDQFKLFVITLVVVGSSMLLYQEKIVTFPIFLKTLLYGNSLYILFKLIAASALIFKWVTFDKLIDFLGIQAMGMAIFGDVQRLQTSMDISTPFLIFFCLESGRFEVLLPKWFKLLFPAVAFLSTVISFSRVLIFIALISFIFHFCLHTFRYFLVGLLLGFSTLCAIVMGIGPSNAAKMVEVRLFSRENSESDLIRSNQITALTDELLGSPVFGMGLGGYSEREIRDLDIKHSYEVQWMALFAQTGFLGILFLILPILFLTLQFFMPPLTKEMLALAILWCGWVASGLTNPFVISLTSGIIYSLFILSYLTLKRPHA